MTDTNMRRLVKSANFTALLLSPFSLLHASYLELQDFEDGTLDGWVAGGRQITGGIDNSWGVSEYAGSQMGYLYHRDFTELTLSKSFSYLADRILSFDAVFIIDGDTSPTPSGGSKYNSYNVMYQLGLLDIDGRLLGAQRYVAETSYWYTNYYNQSGVIDSVFLPNGLQHYEYDISDFASGLGVDTNAIDAVTLAFIGYSPIYNSHTMIVRFDNVGISSSASVVPLPSTAILFGSGLVGFLTFNRRRNKRTQHEPQADPI
jgi:hypothetical protein